VDVSPIDRDDVSRLLMHFMKDKVLSSHEICPINFFLSHIYPWFSCSGTCPDDENFLFIFHLFCLR
jgi:hypothetical protein